MAIKTKEEMFGDGAGEGAQVPISVANPSGHGANNRGTAFGEPVTSSVANRAPYALALNDEDLDGRLATFETDGLDAAYDLGAAAVVGGGRVVTKDAGAIETQSAHADVEGDTARDPAHFRANSTQDTVASSIGFEARTSRVGVDGLSDDDAVAGFLDIRAFTNGSGETELDYEQACLLNPDGVLTSTLRLITGITYTGVNTDLLCDFDLVEIKNSTSDDGMYVVHTLGATDKDVVLRNLDGSTPSFALAEACDVSFYRVSFGSFGSFTGRDELKSNVMVGQQDATSVLDIVPGRAYAADPSGAVYAIQIRSRSRAGVVGVRQTIDYAGRTEYLQRSTDLVDDYEKNHRCGAHASWKDHLAVGGVGHVVSSTTHNATEDRLDFLSMLQVPDSGSMDDSPVITYGASALSFTANSPTQGELLFSISHGSDWQNHIPANGTILQLTGSPSNTSDGHYLVTGTITTGNGGFTVRLLRDATALPSHFPAAGSCVLQGLWIFSAVGRVTSESLDDGLNTSHHGGGESYAANVFSGRVNGAAIQMYSPVADPSTTTAFFRAAVAAPGAVNEERAALDNTGALFLRKGVYAAGDNHAGSASGEGVVIGNDAAADFNFYPQRSVTKAIHLSAGISEIDDTGKSYWGFDGVSWYQCDDTINGSTRRLVFPIEVPRDGTLVSAEIHIDASGSADWTLALERVTCPWTGAPPADPTATPLTLTGSVTSITSVTPGNQIITLTLLTPLVITDTDENTYQLVAITDTQGLSTDMVHGVRRTFLDPGPRNR